MFNRVVEFLLFLLDPRTLFEYVWKLAVLCSLTTAVALTIRALAGVEVGMPLGVYFLFNAAIASPFYFLTMVVVHRMRALQEELARVASTDLLTGLANRRAFFEQTETFANGQLLLLDIDHFKAINDNFGHGVGDEVLKKVAEYLTGHVRETDTVARIGGEEFAVFLPDTTADVAHDIGDRIVRGLTYETDRVPEIRVTLSGGLAEASGRKGLSDLIKRADAALYESKRNGRARVSRWVSTIPSRPNAASA